MRSKTLIGYKLPKTFGKTRTVKRQSTPVDLRPICKALGLPEPVPEFEFCGRKWRFDWAWPNVRYPSSPIIVGGILAGGIALEIDGGTWLPGGGRHNRGKGYEADLEKFAEAACLGWRVLRVTPAMLKDGRAFKWLERMLK